MTERTNHAMGYPGFVSPEPDNNAQVEQARELLISIVRKLCPDFSRKLLTNVFPIYERQANQSNHLNDILWHTTPFRLLPDGELKTALSCWAAEFNASNAEWLLDTALRTMFRWNAVREFKEEQTWAHPGKVLSMMREGIGKRFYFEFTGWETQSYSWGSYSTMARDYFEKQLEQYRKETVKGAEAAGLVPAQKKFAECNLEWLALYQFMGLSQSQIVKRIAEHDIDATADESTVRKGIQAAVKLTGWATLRPPRRIRNRKIQ